MTSPTSSPPAPPAVQATVGDWGPGPMTSAPVLAVRSIGPTMRRRLVLQYLGAAVLIASIAALEDLLPSMTGLVAWVLQDPNSMTTAPLLAPWLHVLLLAGVALLLSLPLAMVYVRTRARLKYDETLVETVIVLPVIVSGILLVVKDSLALAFSLAGIVAAVRFRNNLKDSRDAVYILAAVGVGFAVGVGSLQVAMMLSLVFTAVELSLWRRDVGSDHERTLGIMCLPTATLLDLGRKQKGRKSVVKAAGAPSPLSLSPTAIEREEDEVVLRVYAADVDEGKHTVERVLDEMAKRYRLHEARSTGHGHVTLDYVVKPRKRHSMATIIDAVYERGAPLVLAAEVI
jgi:hypothetical protein